MELKLTKKEARELVEAWEGHIKNDTHCGECKIKSVKCPINDFFKKLTKQLRIQKGSKG